MKFIFPQNYKFNTKLLGIMDYQTAIINLIWGGIVFLIVNTIFRSLSLKICLFIIAMFPMLIFSIVGINGDNLICVVIYMSKFIIKPKLLFYSR